LAGDVEETGKKSREKELFREIENILNHHLETCEKPTILLPNNLRQTTHARDGG